MEGPSLRVGNSHGAIVFGPFAGIERSRRDDGTFDFLYGPIQLHRFGHDPIPIEDTNGTEPAALAVLRDDLRVLLDARSGSLTFGTHDATSLVELITIDPDLIAIVVNCPRSGLPDTDVATIETAELAQIIEQLDAIEAVFGPLVGRCEACVVLPSRYIRDYLAE